MIKFISKIKNISIVTIIASIIIGTTLLIAPETAMTIVSIGFGVMLIALGVVAWINFFTKNKSTFMTILGSISIVAGAIVCARYKEIIAIFLTLFGGFLIISGIIDLVSALNVKSVFSVGWLFSLFMSVAIIVLGAIVVVNPFDSAVVGAMLLGISLLVYAVLDIMMLIQVKKSVGLKEIKDKTVEEINVTVDDIE